MSLLSAVEMERSVPSGTADALYCRRGLRLGGVCAGGVSVPAADEKKLAARLRRFPQMSTLHDANVSFRCWTATREMSILRVTNRPRLLRRPEGENDDFCR